MRLEASAWEFGSRNLCATFVLLASLSCAGPAGPPGPPGTPAAAPDGGPSGTTIAYGTMTPDELQQSKMAMELTSVTIPADGKPVVSMKVTERHGFGVRGTPVADPLARRFAMLKLTPSVNGSVNTSWVSYMAPNDHSSSNTESATAANFTDNGDG